jgi:hypothetical protein
MMYLIVPLSVGVVGTLPQFGLATLFVFCCRVNPAEDDGQDTIAVFEVVRLIVSSGAPAVWTVERKLQNPPVSEKLPPLIDPASG